MVSRDLPARLIIELLRSGQRVVFGARGASMWPAIPSGSRVEVVPCRAEDLRVGEIAAFERHGGVVVHRVTGVGPEWIRFQGDSLGRSDGDVPHEQVLGRARVVERRSLRLRLPRPGDVRRSFRALRNVVRLWRDGWRQ